MLFLLVLGDHCSSASLHQGALHKSRGELGKRPQQMLVLCGHLHEVCRKEAGGGSETDLAGRDPAQLVLAAGGEEGALGSRTVGFCCVK